MENRKVLELEHNKEILFKKDEGVWGWNSAAGRLRLDRRTELISNFISQYSDFEKGKTLNVLELGCGTGLCTEKLQGIKTVALDIYEGFIRKAKDRADKSGKKHHFVVADAECLPFLNETFDVIFGISVLHHLNLKAALKEISRILKPRGRFIFSEPNMLNPQIFVQKNVGFVKRLMGDSPGETAFYPGRLKRLFVDYDLKVSISPFDFLHPKIPKSFIPAVSAIGLFLEKCTFLKYIAGSLLIKGRKI